MCCMLYHRSDKKQVSVKYRNGMVRMVRSIKNVRK